MLRRDFIATVMTLPLLKLEPLLPSDGVQELVLPDDLALGLERHCGLPLEERVVRANEAAQIASKIDANSNAVFTHATDREEYDYVLWSWFYTGKRWKQLAIVLQIAKAGEFTIAKRDGLFVLQTTKCKVPAFKTSERKLIVDFDEDKWSWEQLGDGWPAILRKTELRLNQCDWVILRTDVFDPESMTPYFDGDVLNSEATRKLSERLLKPDINPEPWPGMGFNWSHIANWLAQGECLFVPFPKQPMN